MKNQTWLSSLQDDKNGKKISRILFRIFNNQEGVTKEFNFIAWQRNKKRNPKKPYALPLVNHYFQFWEKERFIAKSKPLREISNLLTEEDRKKLRYLPKNYGLSILNFEPLYRYFEYKNILLTEQEKIHIYVKLSPESVRRSVLKQYPDEDIINAIIKFYIKNYALPYIELYRVESLSKNPEFLKFNSKVQQMIKKKVKSPFKMHLDNTRNAELLVYKLEAEQNSKLIFGLHEKFMKALGLV